MYPLAVSPTRAILLLKVKVVLLVPLQTVASPVMLPGSAGRFTVIVTIGVVAVPQLVVITTL